MIAVKTILQDLQETGDTYANLAYLWRRMAAILANRAEARLHARIKPKPRWQTGLSPGRD
jgi:hypothetical protein